MRINNLNLPPLLLSSFLPALHLITMLDDDDKNSYEFMPTMMMLMLLIITNSEEAAGICRIDFARNLRSIQLIQIVSL